MTPEQQVIDRLTGFYREVEQALPETPPPWRRERGRTGRGSSWKMQAVATAGVLLVAAGVAVLLAHGRWHSIVQPVTPTDIRTVPLSTGGFPLKMIDRNNGWASGALRTTDGGAHWRDVSPPSLPNRQRSGPESEFYLDSNHAWQGQMFADHVVIFRTADGGRTWQQGAPVPIKVAGPPASTELSSELYFIDDRHGWLHTGGSIRPTVGFAYSNDPAAQGVYRTVDGGLHWTLQSTGPGAAATGCFFGSGMTFVSTARGWLRLGCPRALGDNRPELLATSDGGVTWQVQKLTTDSRCPCGLDDSPVFFDSQHGFVQGSTTDGTPLLFGTADGGNTWLARTVPGAGPRGVRLSFADPSAGWAMVSLAKKGPMGPNPTCSSGYAYLATPSKCYPPPEMNRTVDGGRTWALTQTDLFSPDGEVVRLLFVDARNGFAERLLASTQNLQSVLLRTSDGGRTWKLVARWSN